MTSENHHVTPTYQSLLILGMDTVAKRLADGDTIGSWQALRTLYSELPPECQKESRNDFETIEKRLLEIRNIEGVTAAETFILRANASSRYLDSANLQLFNKFKNSLFAKGYLENASTKPRNPTPTTLGE